MAYVSKEKKAKIKAALDQVVPKTWKWSLRVEHHSSILMTISAGPRGLAEVPQRYRHGELIPARLELERQVNTYNIVGEYTEGEIRDTMVKIVAALNTDNFDESDIQTDYHNVGHYVNLHVGRWDKPYVIRDAQ